MDIRSVIDNAKQAKQNAYAPYSNLKIGAALLTTSGKIFTGSNIENSSYGLSICAERVAVSKAVSGGERDFELIVIASDEFAYPCGACRQFLSEFSENLKIILVNDRGEERDTSLQELFPYPFKIS